MATRNPLERQGTVLQPQARNAGTQDILDLFNEPPPTAAAPAPTAPAPPPTVPAPTVAPAPQIQGLDPQLSAILNSLLSGAAPQAPVAAVEDPTIIGEFTTGVGAGTQELLTLGIALGGVVLRPLNEEFSNELFELAQERGEAVPPRAVEFDQAFDSARNFVLYASRVTGEQVPNIASIIAGGGIGTIIGKLAAKKAITAVAAEKIVRRAGITGAVTAASGIETGATGREHFDATGDVNPLIAIGTGVAKGALEAVVPLAFARRFGLGAGQSRDLIDRIAGQLDNLDSRTARAFVGAFGGGTIEAATELAQESIDVVVRDFVDENFELLSPKTADRLLEAAVTGGIVGFIFGGIGGGISPRKTDPEGAGEPLPEPADVPPDVPVTTDEGAVVVDPTVLALPAPTPTVVDPLAGTVATVQPPGLEPILLPDETTEVGESVAEPIPQPETAEGVLRERLVLPRGVTVEDAATGPVTFQAGEDVAETVGRVGIRETDIFAVSPEALEGADTTATLRELPLTFEELTTETPGVTLLDPAQADTALNLAKEAISLRNVGLTTGQQDVLDAAETAYTNAIAAGFRFTPPREGRGFTILDPKAENFQQVTDLPVDFPGLSADTIFREGTETADATGVFTPVGIPARDAFGVSNNVQDTARAFEVDLERIPPENVRRAVGNEDVVTIVTAPGISARQAFPAAFREVPQVPVDFQRAHPFGDRVRGITDFPLGEVPDVSLPNGRPYNASEHKPGTVVLVVESGTIPSRDQLKNLKEIQTFYNRMLRRFKIKERLVILVGNSERFDSVLNTKSNGHFKPYSDGSGLMNFARDRLSDRLGLLITAAHEFGHFLHWNFYRDSSEGFKEQLRNAYNRALAAAISGEQRDFAKAFFPPTRYARGILVDTEPALDIGNPHYWFSFDEWMADQMARWVSLGGPVRSPLDALEKWFKKLAEKLTTLFKESEKLRGMKPEDFRAEPEFEAWIEDLQQRRNEAVPSLTAVAQDSIEREVNLATGFVDPEQGENEETKKIISSQMLNEEVGTRETLTELRKATDYFNRMAKYGYSILQLAAKNLNFRPIQDYVQTVDVWYNKKMEWMARGTDTVRAWRKIGAKQIDNLANFIFHIDQMEYLTREEQENGTIRQPTSEELIARAKRFGLDRAAFEVFIKVRDDMNHVLAEIQRISIAVVRREQGFSVTADVEIAKIDQEFRALRQRPYFPHARFGEFTLDVRDVNDTTVNFETFPTERAAKAAVQQMRKQFKPDDGFTITLGKMAEESQVFQGLPQSLLELIRDKLDLSPKQREGLNQLIIHMSPTRSFRKNLARRKNIPGFSLDAMRTYANYMWHASNHMARIEFGPEMRRIVADGRTDTGKLRETNTRKKVEILDFMENHLDHILNPKPDWAHLRSFAFQWWIGFSPASAVLNFTQIPLTGWPYLAARFSDIAAANEIRKAMVGLRKLYTQPEKFTANLTTEDSKLFSIGFNEGFLEESLATELAGTAQGDVLIRMWGASTQIKQNMWQFSHIGALLFQTSEKINRRVMFKAAVELARRNPDSEYLAVLKQTNALQFSTLRSKEGLSETEALAYLAGKDSVRATQYEYAAWNRPKFMRGPGGLIFTFFMFVQNTVWFVFNSPGNRRMLLTLLFMGGLMGLPGADDMNNVVRFIGRRIFGKDWNPEAEVRELLVELGSKEPDLFLHGASRVGFGMPAVADWIGIPAPRFDMSANVSMGQIIPGLSEMGGPGGNFEESFSRATTDIAGATLGIGINLMKAISDDQLPVDDFKRWERAMPRVLRNLSKAIRFFNEKRERDRSGATVEEFDPADPRHMAEIISQGLGFNPTRLSREWERRNAMREAELFWGIQRQMLMRSFDHAAEQKDKLGQRDVLAAIRKFNNSVPFKVMGITRRQLGVSRKQRLRNRRLRELGLPRSKIFAPLARGISRLHPEADLQPEEDARDVTRPR